MIAGARSSAGCCPGRLLVGAAACAAVLVAAAPPAQSASGHSLDLAIGVSMIYDDNFLQYSDSQILMFESGLNPDRFSIQTTDDLLGLPSVALTWSQRRHEGRSRSIRIRWSGEFHKENKTADFPSYGATYRESFSRKSRLTLAGYWLPRYYIRQLFDEDFIPPFPGLSRYRRAEFSLAIGSAAWRQRLGMRSRAEIEYQLEHRGYNPDFTERTSDTHQVALDFERYRLPGRGTLDLLGGYRISNAKGVDADGLQDDPDVSYRGVIAGLDWGVELKRRKAWRLGADVSYALGTRAYTSDLPSDRYHYRRHDVSHTAGVGVRWSLRPHWALRGLYQFEHNSANLGASAPAGSEQGSYSENRVGLAVEWSGKVWRQASPSAPADEE